MPHVVYVACATDSDHFAELTAISVASLRITNPEAKISLMTDQDFDRLNTPGKKYLKESVDDIIALNFEPSISQVQRSRHLKCQLRQTIEGPLLYLDSDTVVLDSLGHFDTLEQIDEVDIAAVPDIAPGGLPYNCDQSDHFERMKWPAPPTPYLNAGVFYLSDTPEAYKFAEAYKTFWQEYSLAIGKFNEQPAFNRAINEVSPRLLTLPPTFNAQIAMNITLAKNAKIIHYFTGNFDDRADTIGHLLAKQLKATGGFDKQVLLKAISMRNPWTAVDTVKKAIALGESNHRVAMIGARSVLRKIVRRLQPS